MFYEQDDDEQVDDGLGMASDLTDEEVQQLNRAWQTEVRPLSLSLSLLLPQANCQVIMLSMSPFLNIFIVSACCVKFFVSGYICLYRVLIFTSGMS